MKTIKLCRWVKLKFAIWVNGHLPRCWRGIVPHADGNTAYEATHVTQTYLRRGHNSWKHLQGTRHTTLSSLLSFWQRRFCSVDYQMKTPTRPITKNKQTNKMLEEIESVIKDRKSAVSSQRNDVMFVSLKYLMTIMPDHTATKACETTQKGIAPLFVSLDTLHRLRPFIPQVSLAIKTKGLNYSFLFQQLCSPRCPRKRSGQTCQTGRD